jgi:methyl-accepting chemotaxis protein
MIQQETSEAVRRMNGGTGRADESLTLAEQASGTLAEIVRSVRGTIAAIDTITTGASAQRELGEAIRRDAATIVSGTDEVAKGSAQAAQAVAGLLGKADALRRTIDDFASPSHAGHAPAGRPRNNPA